MNFLLDSILKAFELIVSLDRDFLSIVFLSLKVSGTAILVSAVLGIAVAVTVFHLPAVLRRVIVPVLNTSMGLPPVVVGLFLYLLFSRSGPLGWLSLLYTPTLMIIAQTVLATPIVAGIVYASLSSSGGDIRFTALSLGATGFQATMKLLGELRYMILASVIAGLGRVIAEVGAVLIVGGNIAGYTRVMTTAIALEADRGDFILAIALGLVLLMISFSVNLLLYLFQRRAGH